MTRGVSKEIEKEVSARLEAARKEEAKRQLISSRQKCSCDGVSMASPDVDPSLFIACQGCKAWYHNECFPGLSDEQREKIRQGIKSGERDGNGQLSIWNCQHCSLEWPNSAVLEMRVRKLVNHLEKKRAIRQRIQERVEKQKEAEAAKAKRIEEMNKAWTKREKAEFARTLQVFGQGDWKTFRTRAHLSKKTISAIEAYYSKLMTQVRYMSEVDRRSEAEKDYEKVKAVEELRKKDVQEARQRLSDLKKKEAELIAKREARVHCSCREPDNYKTMVGCDAMLLGCSMWYHAECAGWNEEDLNEFPRKWICEHCTDIIEEEKEKKKEAAKAKRKASRASKKGRGRKKTKRSEEEAEVDGGESDGEGEGEGEKKSNEMDVESTGTPVRTTPKKRIPKKKGRPSLSAPSSTPSPSSSSSSRRRTPRPTGTRSRCDLPMNDSLGMVRVCTSILDDLMKLEFADVFSDPVDPEKQSVPTYFDVVKHPMDLGTVRRNLRRGAYSCPARFAEDVRLVWENCVLFNKPGDWIVTTMEPLAKSFEDMYEERVPEELREHTYEKTGKKKVKRNDDAGDEEEEEEEEEEEGDEEEEEEGEGEGNKPDPSDEKEDDKALASATPSKRKRATSRSKKDTPSRRSGKKKIRLARKRPALLTSGGKEAPKKRGGDGETKLDSESLLNGVEDPSTLPPLEKPEFVDESITLKIAKKIVRRVDLMDNMRKAVKVAEEEPDKARERLAKVDVSKMPEWWNVEKHEIPSIQMIIKHGFGMVSATLLDKDAIAPLLEGKHKEEEVESFLSEYLKDKSDTIRRLIHVCSLVVKNKVVSPFGKKKSIPTFKPLSAKKKRTFEGKLELVGDESIRRKFTPDREIERDEEGNPILPFPAKGGAMILKLGEIVTDRPTFHKSNTIWPVGFMSTRVYPSMVDPAQRVEYTSRIIDGGKAPLFVVTASDLPDETISNATASGAWVEVLERINDRKVQKRSKVTVSGPEMFGFADKMVKKMIEELPGVEGCVKYKGMKI